MEKDNPVGIQDILGRMCLETHLEREKALNELKAYIRVGTDDPSRVEDLLSSLPHLETISAAAKWEERQAALHALDLYISILPLHFVHIKEMCLEICKRLINDIEFRVRITVGVLLKSLVISHGVIIYENLKELILENIEKNFIREIDEAEEDLGQRKNVEVYYENPLLADPGALEEEKKKMHDTEGWQNLETSMRVLQGIIEGAKLSFAPYIDENIYSILRRAGKHLNRFVREIGYFLCNTILEIMDLETLALTAPHLAPQIAKGLADNWSQVRFAASVALRTFFNVCITEELRHKYFPLLLPPMCLNRYYMAEGVKLYSQETWRGVVGDKGILLVVQYSESIIDFYLLQARADNHAVREAACHCISEICSKIASSNKEVIAPFVQPMLDGLIDCFKDMSWPVRDAACLACGQFVLIFPQESKPKLTELMKLWLAHLSDNINSVRENSAIALANALRAFQQDIEEDIIKQLELWLPKAEEQEPDSKKFTTLGNESEYGVAKPVNIYEAHMDQQMYSCGSLAPKLKKGGGDTDYGFGNIQQPWEMSDGAIYLLTHISSIKPLLVLQFFPILGNLARIHHFKHAGNLKETLFKNIPVMMKNINKRDFKTNLELLIDPLFMNLKNENRLCVAAAEDCIVKIGNYIGFNIFKGRIEMVNPGYVTSYQQLMSEQGAHMGGGAYPMHPSPMGAGGPVN